MIRSNLPNDKALAGKIIDAEAGNATRRMEMGWIGAAFGAEAEKPGNIAAAVLCFSLIAVLVLLWLSAKYPAAQMSEAIAGFFTIITTTIGYIFGRSHNK